MELLENGDAQVISGYDHYAWKAYAAVTRKEFGKGLCIYMGCMTSPAYLKALLTEIWQEKGWWTWKQEIHFPLIIRERQELQWKPCYLLPELFKGNFRNAAAAIKDANCFPAGKWIRGKDCRFSHGIC